MQDREQMTGTSSLVLQIAIRVRSFQKFCRITIFCLRKGQSRNRGKDTGRTRRVVFSKDEDELDICVNNVLIAHVVPGFGRVEFPLVVEVKVIDDCQILKSR